MYTSLGRFLKKLRLENEEHLYDMAVKLKVSSAFLSKVENGKSKVKEKFRPENPGDHCEFKTYIIRLAYGA